MRTSPAALRAVLLLVVLAAGHAAAAAEYEVEVIVFRHVAAPDTGRAASPAASPDLAAARRLDDHDAGPSAPFTRLPASMLRLAGAAKLLARSGAYELLVHQAWRQPGDAGVAVYVAAPDSPTAPPAAAAGSVRLLEAGSGLRVVSDFVLATTGEPVRVQAVRQLRPGELHYLDHELLGVLLQVTEVLPPVAAPSGPISR